MSSTALSRSASTDRLRVERRGAAGEADMVRVSSERWLRILMDYCSETGGAAGWPPPAKERAGSAAARTGSSGDMCGALRRASPASPRLSRLCFAEYRTHRSGPSRQGCSHTAMVAFESFGEGWPRARSQGNSIRAEWSQIQPSPRPPDPPPRPAPVCQREGSTGRDVDGRERPLPARRGARRCDRRCLEVYGHGGQRFSPLRRPRGRSGRPWGR